MFIILFSLLGFFEELFGQFQQPLSPREEVENLMAFGQHWQAYEKINKMIKQNPQDHELLQLRATCEIQMNMPKEAITDISRIISSKPTPQELRNALSLRAQAYLIQGDFAKAEKDAKSANSRKVLQHVQDAIRITKNIDYNVQRGNIEDAGSDIEKIIRIAPKATKYILLKANVLWNQSNLIGFYETTKEYVNEFNSDNDFNYKYGISGFCADHTEEALKSLFLAKKGKPVNPNVTIAIDTINEFAKNRNLVIAAIADKKDNTEKYINISVEKGLMFCEKTSPVLYSVNLLKIKLYKKSGDKKKYLELLNEVLDSNEASEELLCERGELNLEFGDYDAALFDFQNVLSKNQGNRRAHNGYNKANEMKREATHIDYYKILNVSKSASESEIKASYRKMVRLWHPDRFGDKDKKQKAEQMMKMINKAYDVIGDPQKRRMYDLGQDEDMPQNGGSPFDFDPFDLIRETMGGNPFDFFFNQGDGGGEQEGGQEFHFEGGQGFQFGGGNGFHFEFQF